MTERDTLEIGLLQAELKWREPGANRDHLQGLLDGAGSHLDVAILPETFTTGFLGDPGETEGMDGETVAWMKTMAADYECVLAGSAVIGTPEGRFNRFLWVEPDGGLVFYDKRHLFAFAGEHKRYRAGNDRVVLQYRGWRVMPQICYDLRFPVWCRSRSDYDLCIFVANWPSPRVDAWSTLLKARAIENQCYVAGVNRVGVDGKGNRYPGQSVLHDAVGAELARLDDQEGVARAEISLAQLRATRTELPFLADADRFELMG